MKKFLALLLTFAMLLAVVGCAKKSPKKPKPSSSKDDTAQVSDSASDFNGSDADDSEPFDLSEPSDTDYDNFGDTSSEKQPVLSALKQRANDIIAAEYTPLFESAVSAGQGNVVRLANVIRKLQKGQEVTLAFFGGENTANNGNTTTSSAYPKLVQTALQATYPNSKIKIVTAGYEALTSVGASMMLQKKVLDYKPDAVFLDFSVQDAFLNSAASNSIAFDNIVMRLLNANTAVVALLLTGAENNSFTMNVAAAKQITTAAKQEKKICQYYNIPYIDFESAFWNTVNNTIEINETGDKPLLNWGDFGQTNTGMNETGHANMAGCVEYLFSKTAGNLKNIGTVAPNVPKSTFYGSKKYLSTEFYDVDDLMAGKNGYKFDAKCNSIGVLSANEYFYTGAANANSSAIITTGPKLRTYRHYINPYKKEDVKEEVYEQQEALVKNPLYLEIDVPKTAGKKYLLFNAGSSGMKTANTATIPHSPCAINFYYENGELPKQAKPACGVYSEAMKVGRFVCVEVPDKCVRLDIRVYVSAGLGMDFYGVGVVN